MIGGIATFAAGIESLVVSRRTGISWRAYRFRRQNRLWRIATPVLFWPLPLALVLAPQLYWPPGPGRVSHLLAHRCFAPILMTWAVPFMCLCLYEGARRWRQAGGHTARVCDDCGYNLTGATGDRCSECGHPITGPAAGEKRKTANT